MRKLFALFSFWLFSLVSVVEANAIESSPMLGGPSQTVAVLYITSVAGTATIIGHILYNEAGVAQAVSATNCGTHLIAPRTCSVIFSATVGAYWAVVTRRIPRPESPSSTRRSRQHNFASPPRIPLRPTAP